MDATIVIAHRGNPLGLWATIQSCESDLVGSGLTHNYVVVTNGEELDLVTRKVLSGIEKVGKLRGHLDFREALTPPAARQRGAGCADGEFLFFLDNHCIVNKDYFKRAVAEMRAMGLDSLHSTTRFFTGDDLHYHYKLRLYYNFWGYSSLIPESTYKPYMIAAGGHGGFVVRNDVFKSVGGYGPEDLFVGYGGEEMVFDLKLWRYGFKNWLSPKMIHDHFASSRSYDRHYTDDYYTNLLVSANVIGGEKWLYRVFESFLKKNHIRLRPHLTWYEVLECAVVRSAEHARQVAANSKYSLDELLDMFREQQVAM